MRELTLDETEIPAGGNPALGGFLLAIFGGIIGAYIYDSLGGNEGINSSVQNYVQFWLETYSESIDMYNKIQICNMITGWTS